MITPSVLSASLSHSRASGNPFYVTRWYFREQWIPACTGMTAESIYGHKQKFLSYMTPSKIESW